jgi:hypothetical protein
MKNKKVLTGIAIVVLVSMCVCGVASYLSFNGTRTPATSNNVGSTNTINENEVVIPTPTTTDDGTVIDESGGLNVDIDMEDASRFFNTNALIDESVFIPSDDSSFKGGQFKVIHTEQEMNDFMDEMGFNYNKPEFYFIKKLTQRHSLNRYTIIGFVDSYEENAFKRDANSIMLDGEKVTLLFNKYPQETQGSGFYIYFVFVDKTTLNGEEIANYPLTIQMIE